jgi:hypothetical protein
MQHEMKLHILSLEDAPYPIAIPELDTALSNAVGVLYPAGKAQG